MNKISRILALVVFAVVSSVYIVTMEPTVGFIDSGELSLACAEPGIAHPTGYPLYCLFGRLLKMITGLEAILSSNLFSALAGGFTSAMIFLIASLILSSRGKGTAKKSEVIISAACALFFAFTRTFWGTSTVTEVYAFEMALDMCALFFLLLWTKGGGSKFFILGAYLFGLSFGVHMLTILFAPAVLFLIIIERKKLDYRVFFTSIAFFIIGLTIYIYLPLRSTCDPSANFGDPSTFERFFRHVSAWQYRVWMFNRPIAELFVSLKLFGRQLIADTTIFSIPFVIIGLIFLFRKNRTIFFFLTATFLFDVIYALNYTIPDIEAYYLPAIFVWILLVG
ncbi:DUF2723 domain-containing protein, partial [bacterium]|nr:DUF2723 domain-containing protein [bacterium]